jgi:hypothetical protein
MKYYTRIIHREIKKGLYNDVFIYLLYVSLWIIICYQNHFYKHANPKEKISLAWV